MKRYIFLLIAILQLTFATSGWCGWWIFGQSKDEVTTSYLYLNGTPFDELRENVTVYPQTLDNGEVVVKGKASAGKNRIALVEVSLDGKQTWQPAILSENGAFNFRFHPEMDKTYSLYVKISDTTARTNPVDATHREVTVANLNMRQLVIDALAALVSSYQSRNAASFMALVDQDFAGDIVNLDRALRKDFSLFENIALSFTINNITSSQGAVYTSLTYNRSLFSSRTNEVFRDNGVTDFTFRISDNQLKVASMKNPLIFGVSDAVNVATGIAINSPGTLVLAVDSQGNTTTVPFRDLISDVSGSVTVRW